MKVIGFNFTKLQAERFRNEGGKLKIDTKIDILEINPVKDNPLKDKGDLIEVVFSYDINYEPKLAKLEVGGIIVFSLDSKMAKKILKDWKKKEVDEEFRLPLYNVILRKSTLKALDLEDQLNIPLHMAMPSFKKNQ